jgi:ferredoxin
MNQNTEQSKISIDKEKCIVCGLCSQLYPETFEFDNNEIKVIGSSTKSSKEIEEGCPAGAITINQDNVA